MCNTSDDRSRIKDSAFTNCPVSEAETAQNVQQSIKFPFHVSNQVGWNNQWAMGNVILNEYNSDDD